MSALAEARNPSSTTLVFPIMTYPPPNPTENPSPPGIPMAIGLKSIE